MRSTSRRPVVAAALLTVVALFSVACSSSKSTATTNTSGGGSGFDYSGLSGTLNGSGSTFQQAFDSAAIDAFGDVAPDVTVNYGGGGSGQGKTDLANQVVQWAGSDSTIKDADLPTFKGGTVLYFPTVAAPITVAFNLSGVDSLQLSGETVAKIFGGKATTWNDAAIAADNPGVTLPSTAITIVHRSDGSGTTNQFTKYLTTVDSTDWTLGTGDTVNWPSTTQAAAKNGGVAQSIQQTNGAVGYVDFPDASTAKLTMASVKNKSGSFVAPSSASASAALAGADVSAQLVVNALNASGADSYPITAVTYVLIYQTQPDAGVGNALKGWVNFLITDAQSLAAPNDFAPLSSNIQQKAVTQLATLKIG